MQQACWHRSRKSSKCVQCGEPNFSYTYRQKSFRRAPFPQPLWGLLWGCSFNILKYRGDSLATLQVRTGPQTARPVDLTCANRHHGKISHDEPRQYPATKTLRHDGISTQNCFWFKGDDALSISSNRGDNVAM